MSDPIELIPSPPAEVEATPVFDATGAEWSGIDDAGDVYWVPADDVDSHGWGWAALWRRYGPITWDEP